jgi:Spy/CpxP family protein refolding chaperone
MKKNRFANLMAVAAGFFFLCLAPGLTRAQSVSTAPTQTHTVAPSGSQMKMGPSASDDFAGLAYTDDQKAAIDKIHQETKSHQEMVAKDEKLNADQKDAMILGYTRLEYGQIYRQLTPEQKRQVQQKIRARRAEDEAAKRKQPPTQR